MSLYILYIFELLMGLVERASWIYFGDRWMRRRESCLAVTTAPTMQCLTLYNICALFVQCLYNVCTIFVVYLYNICAICVHYLFNIFRNCSDHVMSYFMFLQYFTISEMIYLIPYPTIHNRNVLLHLVQYLTISFHILPYFILSYTQLTQGRAVWQRQLLPSSKLILRFLPHSQSY